MSEGTVAIIGLGVRIATVWRHLQAAGSRLCLVGYADPDPVGLEALSETDPGRPFADHRAMLERLGVAS